MKEFKFKMVNEDWDKNGEALQQFLKNMYGIKLQEVTKHKDTDAVKYAKKCMGAAYDKEHFEKPLNVTVIDVLDALAAATSHFMENANNPLVELILKEWGGHVAVIATQILEDISDGE